MSTAAPLKFQNTLTRQLEEFKPLVPGQASLYTCGPTVYNYAHIGNFRAYIFEDLLRRVLQLNGYKVNQVMNLTDVDDKTIRDSQKAGLSLNDFTAIYKKAFFEDLKALHIEPAEHYPAATDYIPQMIAMIETLLTKGHAYLADDKCVYYKISAFPEYGKLAKIDMANQRSGTRISTDEYEKESVADFALWKAWDAKDGEVKWDSPWGLGRPGWHIECSAMSHAILGPHFDMHTGGIDNMFPHHEDEIAQSEACHGCKYVNTWLHCAHLQVNNTKMSKSLGNFFTVRQLLDAGFTGAEIRYALISTHYRMSLNFLIDPATKNSESLLQARSAIQRFQNFLGRLHDLGKDGAPSAEAAKVSDEAELAFRNALNDDMNISGALAAVFDFIRDANRLLDGGGLAKERALATLKVFNSILGVIQFEVKNEFPAEALALLEERAAVRKAKDFKRSDEIRDALKVMGFVVEDSATGAKLKKI